LGNPFLPALCLAGGHSVQNPWHPPYRRTQHDEASECPGKSSEKSYTPAAVESRPTI